MSAAGLQAILDSPGLTPEQRQLLQGTLDELVRLRRRAEEAEQEAERERQLRQDGERQLLEAQQRDANAQMLCPEYSDPILYPDDILSSVKIDTALTRFNPAEIEVVKAIYKELQYSKKVPYMTGEPKFAARKLNFAEADAGENVENVLVGECQCGKSLEAAFLAWVAFFILGCLPIVLVRSVGGKDGWTQVFIDKFKLLNIVDKEKDVHAHVKTHRGTALVQLNNPSHLRKLKESYTMGAQRWFPAKLIARKGASWEVQYDGTGETETLDLKDITRMRGSTRVKITEPESLEQFQSVSARKSDRLRMNDAVFEVMNQEFGLKQAKTRVVFVVDEADLVLGNPDRKSNVDSEPAMEDTEYIHTRRGLREHVYGAVSITATPAALFICTFKEMECTACNKSMDSGDELDAGGADGETESDEDSGINDSEGGPSNGSRSVDLERGPALKQELAEYRKFKPHVVFTDRPDNYVAYPAEHWDRGGYEAGNIVEWEASFDMPQNGLKIIRKVVEPRKDKSARKFPFYREVWLDYEKDGGNSKEQAELDWKEMESKALAGEKPEPWAGFVMQCTNTSSAGKSLQVKPPRQKKKTDDEEEVGLAVRIRAEVDALFHTYKAGEDICKDKTSPNNKAIEVRFTQELDTLSLQETNKGMGTRAEEEVTRVMFKERLKPSVQWKNTNDTNDEHDPFLEIKGATIGVLYEALKPLCNRIVVVTGRPQLSPLNTRTPTSCQIGGRGVAYHDLKHERVLTDMFTGQDVPESFALTAHGEYLTQLLGRLNTIETLSQNGQEIPPITLWGSEALHDVHNRYLQKEGSYEKGLKTLNNWATGTGADSYLRMCNPAFSKPNGRNGRTPRKGEQEMRSGKVEQVPIAAKRVRPISDSILEEEAALLPPHPQVMAERHFPDTDEVAMEGDQACPDWDPTSGEPFDPTGNPEFHLNIASELLASNHALRAL
ncbi:hypothetical protein T484DRAFT_1840958, partial [Baffinella frigidus]